MLNSHQPAFRPPTTPNSKTKNHKFPASLSAVQFWRGVKCVVRSPCACGSSQRSLIRVSFAPNNAHSSLVCRGSRRYLARLLATTSAPTAIVALPFTSIRLAMLRISRLFPAHSNPPLPNPQHTCSLRPPLQNRPLSTPL